MKCFKINNEELETIYIQYTVNKPNGNNYIESKEVTVSQLIKLM